MSRIEYEGLSGVNYSTLKHILRSPAAYQESLRTKDEKEIEADKVRFAVGTLAHGMILENKDLRHFYAIKPAGMSFATGEGKLWKAQQTLPILKEDDANAIPRMAEAIASDPDASEILRACPIREVPVVAEIEGVMCKGLLDALGMDVNGMAVIPDIKTGPDARMEAFQKKIVNLSYDFQAEFYSMMKQAQDGLTQKPWAVWIVVENRAPWGVQCYYPEPDVWASGRRKVMKALNILKECRKTGLWPGYSEGVKPISMPRWANWEDDGGEE